MSRPATPDALARARSKWLGDMRTTHRDDATVGSALKLAGAEWRCGNHEAALAMYLETCARAPGDETAQVALLRALTSLGHRERAESHLQQALRSRNVSPMLALIGVQLRFDPANLQPARDVLALAREPHPALQLYADALDCIASGTTPNARHAGDAALDARWNGYCWLAARHPAPLLTGLSVDVLDRATELAQHSGLVMECGVYFGRSIRLLAARFDQTVHGFDSFEGLPEAWSDREPAGAYSTGGVIPKVPKNVALHRGWFARSLPRFLDDEGGPIRLLHVDCDLYSSTRCVLDAIADRLVPGSVLLFDDFVGYRGSEAHEFRAFMEFAQRRNLDWQVRAGHLLGREVCIEIVNHLPPSPSGTQQKAD